MGGMSYETQKKHICIGLLAHVDAGKTTLSEGFAYRCGITRELGRVDHKNSYLDTNELERERGITIFSKMAQLKWKDCEIALLDTPGHVDFSAEMERTLQVLDYAVLIVSGADGVQGHTITLFRLLEHYHIPTFVFFNKMDQPDTDPQALLDEIRKRLGEGFVDFSSLRSREEKESAPVLLSQTATYEKDLPENIAVCDEAVLEDYLETGELTLFQINWLMRKRKLFPCFFGSALKLEGVTELLDGIEILSVQPESDSSFGAKFFKISRDDAGNRLTFLKVTGGILKVKETLQGGTGDASWTEKIDQIRLYSGDKYQLLKEAKAGMVVAVTGLSATHPGEGLGEEPDSPLPVLEPVLTYQLLLPADVQVTLMLRQMRELEEEDPQLHVVWREDLKEIHVMLMGEVQTQVLKSVIWDRFHVAVDFDEGSVVYKETIASPAIGIGHFEPLRHYAEVHLLLEPAERGSGINCYTALSEDVLDRNWQRLIFTHLMEKEHLGVLTGSPVTDLAITLINGRAHIKHTEGGDFRQATYRAVRNGLKKAKSILLEPYYAFRLELPPHLVGRALTDIQQMGGRFSPPEVQDDFTVISGEAPVGAMRSYPRELLSYSSGQGRITLTLSGYEPCREQERIVEELGYDSERDLENPAGSVFCAHGAGFIVPWDEVEEYMHLSDAVSFTALSGQGEESNADSVQSGFSSGGTSSDHGNGAAYHGNSISSGTRQSQTGTKRNDHSMGSYEQDKELQAIFERTFGPVKTRLERMPFAREITAVEKEYKYSPKKRLDGEEYLLVDGYNVIFAWPELSEMAKTDIYAAQQELMDVLCNYQGVTGQTLILVFDAYKMEGHPEEVRKVANIYVVYTKEAETADMYIERTVHKLAKNHKVTVATSDGLEQIIILGQGAARISAAGLKEEVKRAAGQIRETIRTPMPGAKSYLFDHASEEVAKWIEELRLGKKK